MTVQGYFSSTVLGAAFTRKVMKLTPIIPHRKSNVKFKKKTTFASCYIEFDWGEIKKNIKKVETYEGGRYDEMYRVMTSLQLTK